MLFFILTSSSCGRFHTVHEHVTRTNDGEVGLTGPALSLLKGKTPHWYYLVRCIRMVLQATSVAPSANSWAPPRNAENGIRTLAARMCCAGPGREEIGTFAATECLCLWLIGVLHDREEVAACSECTSASIFGLEAAALYLYYNRGSVVNLSRWLLGDVQR